MAAGAVKSTPDQRAFIQRLTRSRNRVERIAKEVERSPELVQSVIAAIGVEEARPRLAAAKLLRIVSENRPELVYAHFDFLTKLLRHENSILRWNAILALANLAAIDRQKKLDRILDRYLEPISGPALIDAGNTIRGAAVIARAKPHLADQIARGVLRVENASYATPECRNVAIGHAIRALDEFVSLLGEKERAAVEAFVARQMSNPRPATRSKAAKFCRRWCAPRPAAIA